VNIALMDLLRGAGGAFVAHSSLGTDLGMVQRELAELEQFGFTLENHPQKGVAYRAPAQRLCPDQIEWGWTPQRIGRRIAVWNRLASTNDLAARASGSRTNDGLVILAEVQTSGRGRRGRAWVAPAESSILMSVLLFPPEPLASPAWLTALGAVASAEIVEEFTGLKAAIKWPNDVRVNGCKIGGILVERGQGAVLGIGLNVNVQPDQFPASIRDQSSSLEILSGRPVDRSEVARALIQRLDERYVEGLHAGPDALAHAWRARFEPLGRLVRVRTTAATLMAGHLLDAHLMHGLAITSTAGVIQRLLLEEVATLHCDDDDLRSI
jgi:BirA family biotin operon repressor/biotin-[acetyl-CoA-carboxylase] ligase